MDSLIYEDKTHKDIWLKLILAVPVIIILVTALLFLANNNAEDGFQMLGIVALMVIIFLVILPRGYLIFGNKIKIAFIAPFSFTIPFETIKTARIPRGAGFGINLPSSISSKHAVEIVRKGRLGVNITPENRDLFLGTLEKAMSDWQEHHNRGEI